MKRNRFVQIRNVDCLIEMWQVVIGSSCKILVILINFDKFNNSLLAGESQSSIPLNYLLVVVMMAREGWRIWIQIVAAGSSEALQ